MKNKETGLNNILKNSYKNPTSSTKSKNDNNIKNVISKNNNLNSQNNIFTPTILISPPTKLNSKLDSKRKISDAELENCNQVKKQQKFRSAFSPINSENRLSPEKSFKKPGLNNIMSIRKEIKDNDKDLKNFSHDINLRDMSNINNNTSPNSKNNLSPTLKLEKHPIEINNLYASVPNYEITKCSLKSTNYVNAYAVNTNAGIIRTYNEDRVSIILNIVKPVNSKTENWPKCSFFALFDGHGGSGCANFLKDNLHNFIIQDSNFPENPKEAILNGFANAEIHFINEIALSNSLTKSANGLETTIVDKSGSCALILLLVDDICYVANVGDSRALLSLGMGLNFQELTSDHKPNTITESKRIIANQGKIYHQLQNQILLGPHRVFPGRLSVSRAFGNAEAKLPQFGGMQNVIIAIPDIMSFRINSESDFVVMGCDGVYDQMTNEEVIKSIWLTTNENVRANNVHIQCGLGVDLVLKTSLLRKTLDNVTCIIIAFQNFEKIFNKNKEKFEILNTMPNMNDLILVTNNEVISPPIKIKNNFSTKNIKNLDLEMDYFLKNNKKLDTVEYKEYKEYPFMNVNSINSPGHVRANTVNTSKSPSSQFKIKLIETDVEKLNNNNTNLSVKTNNTNNSPWKVMLTINKENSPLKTNTLNSPLKTMLTNNANNSPLKTNNTISTSKNISNINSPFKIQLLSNYNSGNNKLNLYNKHRSNTNKVSYNGFNLETKKRTRSAKRKSSNSINDSILKKICHSLSPILDNNPNYVEEKLLPNYFKNQTSKNFDKNNSNSHKKTHSLNMNINMIDRLDMEVLLTEATELLKPSTPFYQKAKSKKNDVVNILTNQNNFKQSILEKLYTRVNIASKIKLKDGVFTCFNKQNTGTNPFKIQRKISINIQNTEADQIRDKDMYLQTKEN